ncbi:MAG TPA: type II toxin-antitoxin system prevent-host-death family antitoxin [Thermoanaerobaculia bacterium]|nr:type II toxin-antitoxin system prevent-host-death family antitoxin [Thermoanaerobaculia bacterium]
MTLTASKLRENIYRILDEVLETGVPVEIERRGRMLKIVPVETRGRLANLKPNPGFVIGDPEDLVHLDWSSEWKPYLDDEDDEAELSKSPHSLRGGSG